MTMATRGADIMVSGDSVTVGSEGGAGAGGDDRLGPVVSAFVSFRSGFGSEKLSFCRFPGKHIPRILKR